MIALQIPWLLVGCANFNMNLQVSPVFPLSVVFLLVGRELGWLLSIFLCQDKSHRKSKWTCNFNH